MSRIPPLEDAVRLIRSAEKIVIASHSNPDPDAVGSLIGLGLALREMDKKVLLLNESVLPSNLDFLDGYDLVSRQVPPDFSADLFIALDSSDPERLGELCKPFLSAIPTLVIDHHITNLNFGSCNLIDVEAVSTAEMIAPLLDAMDHSISQPVAEALLTGVVGDTISFSVPGVIASTFSIAGRYVAAGANVSLVNQRVFASVTLNELRLLGIGLTAAQLEDGVLWTVLRHTDRVERGLVDVSKTRLSNLLLGVKGVIISASFSENPDSTIEISLRAREGYDVASIALELGGGGHKLAAGCTVSGPLEDVLPGILIRLKQEANRDKEALQQ